MKTPLETMYPNRCYDCLAVCDDFLCPKCQAAYDGEKQRRKERS